MARPASYAPYLTDSLSHLLLTLSLFVAARVMLNRIRHVQDIHQHVRYTILRSGSASNTSRNFFHTINRLHYHPREDSHDEARDVKQKDTANRAFLVNSHEHVEGEYTSLASNLDHFPLQPQQPTNPPSSPATYQPNSHPLSSLLPPPFPNHSSLCTFLAHSRRTGLNPNSTVFTGTRYEYLALSSLRRLGIEVLRVGGTGDRGVDGVGWWWLPPWRARHENTQGVDTKGKEEKAEGTGAERIKVLLQCKRISRTARSGKSIGPSVVRELEGAFRGAPAGWRGATRSGSGSGSGADVLGILVSTRAATRGVLDSMRRSNRPLACILLEEIELEDPPNEEISWDEDVGMVSETGGIPDALSPNDAVDATQHMKLEQNRESAETNSESESESESESSNEHSSRQPNRIAPSQYKYRTVTGRITQILWNQRAREMGLDGLDVVKRYDTGSESGAGAGVEEVSTAPRKTIDREERVRVQDEVVLMCRGRVVEGLPAVEEEEINNE